MSFREQLEVRGFVVLPNVVSSETCEQLAATIEEMLSGRPGNRSLLNESWCSRIAETLQRHAIVSSLLPAQAQAVQCICFDKSPTKNWLVAWHQDLAIPVHERIPQSKCRGWSVKDGTLYVQPPEEVMSSLLVARLQLDGGLEDGALRVIAGTHTQGRLSNDEIVALRRKRGEELCAVPRGGVLVMRPLLLHASSKIRRTRRRILHFLFGPSELPYGLSWPHS